MYSRLLVYRILLESSEERAMREEREGDKKG